MEHKLILHLGTKLSLENLQPAESVELARKDAWERKGVKSFDVRPSDDEVAKVLEYKKHLEEERLRAQPWFSGVVFWAYHFLGYESLEIFPGVSRVFNRHIPL